MRPVPPKELTIALDWHGVLDVDQQGPYLNPEIIQHLVRFTQEYAPINLIVLSFVGSQRRREVALEHARTTAGLQFSQIKIVHEKLGRGGKADPLQGLGVQSAIVREAQKTGCAAFRNFPHFGPSGFSKALESIEEFIESRNRNFVPAAGGLHPSNYLGSSTVLHPNCPAVGSFDSLSLQAVKTVALRGTACLQLQALDLQTFH